MMKRVLPLLVITLFLAGLFVIPSVGITSEARLQENRVTTSTSLVNNMKTSELPNDPASFRVALYNE
ncbi:MAG: hypothetical protein P1Q69_20940, partial [Candidatus Thorarchaeota archaeon]|nr:hypothetical protein [Candidatus Thorarchaeota archaeon]